MICNPQRPRAKRPRVLQVTRFLASTGGIETCVKRLADDLVQAAIDNEVAVPHVAQVPTTVSQYWPVVVAPFSEVDTLLRTAWDYQPDLVVIHHVGDARITQALDAEYRTAEIVHGPLCPGNKLFRRTDRLCQHAMGSRCLLDWYAGPCGPSASPFAAYQEVRRDRKYLAQLSRVKLILAGSYFMRDWLVGEGVSPNRVRVVDFSAGVSQPVPHDLHESQARDRSRILFVGRVVYAKGLQYLIRAMAELDESYSLEVVGQGWYLPDTKALAQELNLLHRIEFLDTAVGPALDSAYERADLVVVPSIYPEPLGLVVGEARAVGLPVVVTDAGGLPEWAVGDSGVTVVPRADARELARAVSQVRQLRDVAPREERLNRQSLSDAIICAVRAKDWV